MGKINDAFMSMAMVLTPFIYVAPAHSQSLSYTATKVTSGQSFQCVLFSNGRIKCFGMNTFGNLGTGDGINHGDVTGTMGSKIPFVDLGSNSSGTPLLATDVQAGIGHVCAILSGGGVKCWGLNNHGQLGYGDTTMRGLTSATLGNNLPYINLGTGLTAKQLALGSDHTCVLLSSNGVKCWGRNDFGQLGQGHTSPLGLSANQMGDQLAPINLGTGRTAKVISGGLSHTCAVLDNNQMKCWGYNGDGELGIETSTNMGSGPGQMGDSLPAVNLGTGLVAASVSAGSSHTCVVLNNSQLKCWGDNWAGQLGIGSSAASVGSNPGEMGDNLPVVNFGSKFGAGTKPVLKVMAGFYQTCVLLMTNQMKCFGENDFGELGLGLPTGDFGLLPSDMGDSLPFINFGRGLFAKSMSSQYGTTCVIMQNSNVKCWGINTSGALGLGDTVNRGGSASDMGDNLPTVQLGPDGSSTGSSSTGCLSLASVVVALPSTSISLTGGASIGGAAVLLGTSTLSLSGGSTVSGEIFTPSASYVAKSNGTSTGELEIEDLTVSAPAITKFATSLSSLTPTQNFPSGISSSQTINGNGGVNVIAVTGNINLNGASTLTLNGTTNDQFIVLVSGTVNLSGSGHVALSGGVPAKNVIYVVTSISSTGVSLSGGASIIGTLLAPQAGINLSGGGTYNGAIFAGGAISLSGGTSISPAAFCPTGSSPVFM